MNSNLKNVAIAAAGALIGGALVFLALKGNPELLQKLTERGHKSQTKDMVYNDIIDRQEDIRQKFDNLFNDDFLNQKDPFEEMRKMRKQMERRMERFGGKQANPFDSWFSDKFGGGTIDDISMREDANYVYYDLKVEDISSTSIHTKIENGYITITGSTEKKSGSPDGDSIAESTFKSSFSRSFPLPEHVDPNKMEMTSEKDKIVIKFPKLKT